MWCIPDSKQWLCFGLALLRYNCNIQVITTCLKSSCRFCLITPLSFFLAHRYERWDAGKSGSTIRRRVEQKAWLDNRGSSCFGEEGSSWNNRGAVLRSCPSGWKAVLLVRENCLFVSNQIDCIYQCILSIISSKRLIWKTDFFHCAFSCSGSPRDFNEPDLQCSSCYKWFHVRCITFNVGWALFAFCPKLICFHLTTL